MSAFAPVAVTEVRLFTPRATAATPSTERRRGAPVPDREALRREAERAAQRRAQAERTRDNTAARHPLALR